MGEGGLITVRALLYGGTLIAFGLPAYLACAPVAAGAWLSARRGLWAGVALAASAALAATIAHLALLTAAMNGVAPAAIDREMLSFVVGDMPVGRAALVRGGALLLLVPVALLAPPAARQIGTIALGAVALATLPWNGHAMMNAGAAGWAHLAADEVHLAAASVWIGGVAALLRLSVAVDSRGAPARAEAVARFALLGTLAVAALVLTGIVNMLMIADVRTALDPAQPWSRLLAVKLLIFAFVLGLAANNRFRIAPALERAPAAPHRELRYSLALELGLLLAIVGIIGVLGLTSPEG